MQFYSILYPTAEHRPSAAEPAAPDYFPDLNLDRVVAAIVLGRGEYHLTSLYHSPLGDAAAVAYRQAVFRDLRNQTLRSGIQDFARRMSAMREHLSQVDRVSYADQKRRWFLDAVDTYGRAVEGLAGHLTSACPRSAGLRDLRDQVCDYVASDGFTELRRDGRAVLDELAAIRYSLTVRGDRLQVSRYRDEPDYSAEVAATFEKFRQGRGAEQQIRKHDPAGMNRVEAVVLGMVAKLYPGPFRALEAFADRHADFLNPMVVDFDREVQFYLAYLDYTQRIAGTGLTFCQPEVTEHSKEVYARDTFDLALADKLVHDGTTVVRNDFFLTEPERVIVVTGPNQGGKTTFARTVGQLHHLASLGCPVPGTRARLFLPDRLFTHFEREEDAGNRHGRLEDDLLRVHEILDRATPRSLVILNEIFTSTTLQDALLLGSAVLRAVIELDALCVCVTFVDEWAALGPTTVSMASTVVPGEPARRTFRFVRRAPDGLSYADTLADKHGLTYERLSARIGP